MLHYSPEDLTARDTYKLLSGSIIPRPIAWVTTQNSKGLTNLAPFSFFNIVSSNPPLLSISFTAAKDTLNNILATKEAVIQLVNSDNVQLMNETASRLSAELSEPEQFGIELRKSEMLKTPSVSEAKVWFETTLYQHISLENEGHLVLLKIVHFSFADEIIDENNFHIDASKLDPVARLAGNFYSKLGENFELKRPK